MTSLYEAELVNKFSKYVKMIGNRVVEVEFYWFQASPCQCYRLRVKEEQFNEAQRHIRSKKLVNMKFEQFVDLITPVFANEAAEISNSVLRSTFDCLFDQNSNGTIEQEEFDCLFLLLQGVNTSKQDLLHENLRQLFGHRLNHISFKDFYEFVKCGYLRDLLMIVFRLMKGVTALVISSLHGLGLNIVHQLARQGCNIVVNGYANDNHEQSRVWIRSANLQKEIEIQNLVEEILDQFQHVDILIVNNQCQRHYRASIEEFPIEHWKEIIDTNLISTFILIKTLWPHMKRQHFGRIIHLANEHSSIVSEYQSACITSHHALIGLNKALSIEGAPYGITSNIICPGYGQINTFEQFHHIKTLADLILFLCTDQARSINGQLIPWPT